MDLINTLHECSQTESFPQLDLASINLQSIPKGLLNKKFIAKYDLLPLGTTADSLYIAIAKPPDKELLDELRFCAGKKIYPVLVDATQLKLALNNINSGSVGNQEDLSVIQLVNEIMIQAIKQKSSDIHFEPFEKSLRVRIRIDGLLHNLKTLPKILSNRIISRLKVLASLDIAERRLPQDGKFKFTTGENDIDIRISTCPTIYGEKTVLRILNSTKSSLDIKKIGLSPDQKKSFLSHIKKPQGMVIVTGPTGSGKTITLYTALDILNQPNKNIISVEDPVEINLEGINQINVNPKIGLGFAEVLRSFLRQDPDIIMLGEMRDTETADIAMKAAQTGHLVLSTLHTNSAQETLTRLLNMELPRYNIATSISLIISQRLLRKLCNRCKIIDDYSKKIKTIYTNSTNGCEHCHKGYHGRIGVFEFFPITSTIKKAILDGANSLELGALAKKNGMTSLIEDAIMKAKMGLTSLNEINRVIGFQAQKD